MSRKCEESHTSDYIESRIRIVAKLYNLQEHNTSVDNGESAQVLRIIRLCIIMQTAIHKQTYIYIMNSYNML